MFPSGGSSSNPPSTPAAARSKRQITPAACENCRRAKIKCDGHRPCESCTRRSIHCNFTTEQDETVQQAYKRRYTEFQDLYRLLCDVDEEQALQLLQRIRDGESIDSLLQNEQRPGSPHRQRPVTSTTGDRRRRLDLLTTLAASTASLQEILPVAETFLSSRNKVRLPAKEVYRPFLGQIVNVDLLSSALAESQASEATGEGTGGRLRPKAVETSSHAIPHSIAETSSRTTPHSITERQPPYRVMAAPWVTIPISDHAASELITVFFSFVNSYWRFVEEGPFLIALCNGDPSSPNCSPLLVNAILAAASLFSEIDEAFAVPEQLLTRGEHFHREAVRLLVLEEGHVSLSNIQALLVLGFDSCHRGKDKLGWTFTSTAARMNERHLWPDAPLTTWTAEYLEHARLRQCVSYATEAAYMSFAVALLRPVDFLPSYTREVIGENDCLPDSIVDWIGYPLMEEAMPVRLNLIMRCRIQLTRLMRDAMIVLFGGGTYAKVYNNLAVDVQELRNRLHNWYDALPLDLRYRKVMPAVLFDLHAQYHCAMLTLYKQGITALFDGAKLFELESDEQRELRQDMQQSLLRAALTSALTLRDYREMYGLKVAAFMDQLAGAATFVLLEIAGTAISDGGPSASMTYQMVDGDMPTYNANDGLLDSFRHLLGAGMHQMLPRGMARMAYHSAKHLDVPLPAELTQMLQIVAETAWRPSDVYRLDSIFPNWIVTRNDNEFGVGTRYEMEEMLREWQTLEVNDKAARDTGAQEDEGE